VRISSKFQQFTGKKVLIIVAGSQEADFYIAGDGEIEKVRSFVVRKPRYSDREGFSVRSAGRKIIGSGSANKAQSKKLAQDVAREFEQSLKALARRSFDMVYLCAPADVISVAREHMQRSLSDKLKKTVRGNFFKQHPFEILEKLAAR